MLKQEQFTQNKILLNYNPRSEGSIVKVSVPQNTLNVQCTFFKKQSLFSPRNRQDDSKYYMKMKRIQHTMTILRKIGRTATT